MGPTVRRVHASGFSRAVLLSALLTGCAQVQTPQAPREPAGAPALGALDGVYDRAAWRAFGNPDGRTLLEHTTLQKCFVNPQPDADFLIQGFSVKREEKAIGPTRYEVFSLFEKLDLWEIVYVRAGAKAPILGVFSTGKCQIEAERILQTYEQALRKQ